MTDAYATLAIAAAVAVISIGAMIMIRRRRIQSAYDEMRKLYGRDWQ